MADGTAAFTKAEKDTVEFTRTHKVVEIDAEGRASKELVHFSAWQRTKGDEVSTDLKGVHIMVTGRGPTRSWKLMTPGTTPSASTKEWLDKHYGPDEKGEFGEALKPSKAVAIGETWDVDVVKLQASFGKDMMFDAAKSSVKATLVGVEGDVATIHIAMKLQITTIAGGPGMTMKVLEGGVLEMTGDGHSPLSAEARNDGGTMTMKLDAKTDAPNNMTTTMLIGGDKHGSTKAGGEMPEVPAATEAPVEQPAGK